MRQFDERDGVEGSSILGSLEAKDITYESFLWLTDLSPKRICFSSHHKEALKKLDKSRHMAKFAVPFEASIKPIFEAELNIPFPDRVRNYFFYIDKDDEYEKIAGFVKKYNNIVFLRDCLDLSISLSENLDENNEYTPIGLLEEKAKYKGDANAITELTNECSDFISRTPFYYSADLICAIPPSIPNQDSLPFKIVKSLHQFSKKNISGFVHWKKKKPYLKDLKDVDEKWQALAETELQIDCDVADKNIILIDDLYQSGITMHYVAMRLKEAGAKLIYGLSLVKARNNMAYAG